MLPPGSCDKFIMLGKFNVGSAAGIQTQELLKRDMVSNGVPAQNIFTIDTKGILDAAQCALQQLTNTEGFSSPRYDMLIIAAPHQQRRAWQTCLLHFPDWVWIHNAAVQSTTVNHGITIDNSWEVLCTFTLLG